MAGFFLTFLPITACIAWSQYLAARWAPATWFPLIGAALWTLALGLAITGLYGSEADLDLRVDRMTDAALYAQWIAIATVLAMMPVTAFAFTRPATAPPA